MNKSEKRRLELWRCEVVWNRTKNPSWNLDSFSLLHEISDLKTFSIYHL